MEYMEQQMQNFIEAGISEADRCYARIAELEQQNAALAAQVKELKSELRQGKLIHIGFTNESQVQYVTEDKEEGAFYPNSDNGCYIPVYMLNVHAHRVGPDSKIYCTQLEQGKKIAEIRAEAGRAGFVEGIRLRSKGPCNDWQAAADQYAEQIRREVE